MSSSQDSSWADVSLLLGLPAAVRAALVLNIPKIIDSAHPVAALSAQEICKHVPGGREEGHSEANPQNLEKLLDWLSCNGIFSQILEEEGGCKVKKYGHSPKSRCLSKDQTSDAVLMYTDPKISTVFWHAHEMVLNPDVAPFELVTGKFMYKYLAEDAPDIQGLYVRILNRTAAQALRLLEERYDEEFKALKGRVVDVGGQEGTICAGLAEKYPHLQFVNFDLPEVVRTAPQIPRVEHVGGSFLDSVPHGDLLIMKYVLLNWDDMACIRILMNCRDALGGGARGGKVLIIDRVDRSSEADGSENSVARTASAWSNFQTSVLLTGGRTRNVDQLRSLALAVGFSTLEFVHHSPGFDLLEANIGNPAIL